LNFVNCSSLNCTDEKLASFQATGEREREKRKLAQTNKKER